MRTEPRHELPRLVLFDVGNVLIALRSWREALPAEPDGAEPAEETLRNFREGEACLRFERGLATVAEFCEAVRRVFSSRLEDGEIIRRYARLLGEEVDGMRPLIADLKRHGVRVAALTNTSPVHLEALRGYAVVRELELLLASCATGRVKPEAEAFQHALECLQVRAQDVFFTDDLAANVEGARQAGLRAEVFQDAASLRCSLGI